MSCLGLKGRTPGTDVLSIMAHPWSAKFRQGHCASIKHRISWNESNVSGSGTS